MVDQQSIQILSTKQPRRRMIDNPAVPEEAFFGTVMEIPRISVIVPARNEAKNLPYVLPGIPGWVYEVILVDGHSMDNTIEVAQSLLPSVRVVHQEGRGKGNALRAGFEEATGDIIVMLDADGSTDPCEIPVFIGSLLSGADYVKGSRFLQGGGSADITFLRKIGNWFLLFFTRLLFGGQYSDLCYGYNAFWKWVVPRLNLNSDGFEIETEMNIRALRQGLRVAEVSCFEAKRIYGESNLNTFRDGWRVLKTILSEAIQHYRSRFKTGARYSSSTKLYPE